MLGLKFTKTKSTIRLKAYRLISEAGCSLKF